MADSTKKSMSEADKSANRVAARKAKDMRDRKLRGDRDLSDTEKYAVQTLRMAIKAAEIAIENVNQGKGFDGGVLTKCSEVCQAHNASLGK